MHPAGLLQASGWEGPKTFSRSYSIKTDPTMEEGKKKSRCAKKNKKSKKLMK
jgi:hypothetical protein